MKPELIGDVIFKFLRQVEPDLLLRLHGAAKRIDLPELDDNAFRELVEISYAASQALGTPPIHKDIEDIDVPDFSKYFHDCRYARLPAGPPSPDDGLEEIPRLLEKNLDEFLLSRKKTRSNSA